MLSRALFGTWLATGVAALCGLPGNVFILSVALRERKEEGPLQPHHRRRRHPAADIITGSLALFNALYQLAALFWLTLDALGPPCLLGGLALRLMVGGLRAVRSSLVWVTAYLCYYYRARIMAEARPLWPRLRALATRRAPAVVAGLALLSLASNLTYVAAGAGGDHDGNSSSSAAWGRCGGQPADSGWRLVYLGGYVGLMVVVPAGVMVTCSLATLLHLLRHTRHLKATSNAFRAPRRASHMRVVRMLLLLVSVFVACMTFDLLVLSMAIVHTVRLQELGSVAFTVYTAVSSAILIYGNRKLLDEIKELWKGRFQLWPTGLLPSRWMSNQRQVSEAPCGPPAVVSGPEDGLQPSAVAAVSVQVSAVGELDSLRASPLKGSRQ